MLHPLMTVSGKPIGRYAFGTMQFGGKADASTSRVMFDMCRASGVSHFDTAVLYTDGASEKILGPMVAEDRDDLFVATKLGYVGGNGQENLRAQMDRSRRQLGVDQVDLLYLHRWDPDTDLIETFSTLAEFQSQGWIRHIGVSNFAAWQVMKAQAVAETLGTQIDAIQPMYNLVKRQAEVEIMPMAQDQNMAIIPYSPLGGGMLTGKYLTGETGRLSHDERYAERYGYAWMVETTRALAALAKDQDVNPATLAAAWVAAHPFAPIPILSASSPEQLTPSLDAIDFKMDAALYDQISGLSPAPPPATDRNEEA